MAILMVAVLHFIRSEEDPSAIVKAFADQMAPGSYLVISHSVSDNMPPAVLEAIIRAYGRTTAPAIPRTISEVGAFFSGLELVTPGLADVTRWRAEQRTRAGGIQVVAEVGRKPGA